MDCMMPGMDGFAATRLLRDHLDPRVRGTPVFALTASAMPEDRARCERSGMDRVLIKPISRDELGAALAEVAPPRRESKAA